MFVRVMEFLKILRKIKQQLKSIIDTKANGAGRFGTCTSALNLWLLPDEEIVTSYSKYLV